MTITAEQQRRLDEIGFLVHEDFIERGLLGRLRSRIDELFDQEGDRAGIEFKQETGSRRLANLVNKGKVFEEILAVDTVLDCVRSVVGSRFKLSSLNARSANPRSGIRQPLHADQGAVADEQGYWVCNTVWMLDDFTCENGALRAVPGSHRFGKLPQDALADPLAPHPDEMLITAAAGSVIVMNAHMWHGAIENRTDAPRRAVHVFYVRSDKPQQQYQKQMLDDEVQRRLHPQLRQILALDDPLNDLLSVAPATRSGFLK